MTCTYPSDSQGVTCDFGGFSPLRVSYNTYKSYRNLSYFTYNSYRLKPYFTYKYDKLQVSPSFRDFKEPFASPAWAADGQGTPIPFLVVDDSCIRSGCERAWVTVSCDKRELSVVRLGDLQPLLQVEPFEARSCGVIKQYAFVVIREVGLAEPRDEPRRRNRQTQRNPI